jgi:hypothetical protein
MHQIKDPNTMATRSTRSQGSRRTSKVWEFFKLVPASAATNWKRKAVCPTCRTELTAESSSGTSHLNRHRCFKEWKVATSAADQDMSIYDGLNDIQPLDRSDDDI